MTQKILVGPFKTVDISGMGGDYENACQVMLWRGVAYLDERKPPVEMWKQTKQSPNIVGILITEGEDLKALEKYIVRDIEPSGAMHQAVMNHIAYIHKHGQDGWLKEGRKHGANFYEWEGEL